MAKKYVDMTTREKSRMAQNERRKIERRMARVLRDEFGVKTTAKEVANIYAGGKYSNAELEMLSKQRESLFAKKEKGGRRKGYAVNLQQVSESISAYTQLKYGMETLSKKGNVTQNRKNKLFERSINQSTMKEGFSLLEKETTKAFYAGTQDLWKGKSSSSEYNTAIMEEFGVNNLETVYKLLTDKDLKKEDFGFSNESDFQDWLKDLDEKVKLNLRREAVRKELNRIEEIKTTGGTTEDESYNMPDEKETETSPEYINRIISRVTVALNG